MEQVALAIIGESMVLGGFIAGLWYANHRCDKRFEESQKRADERERRLVAAIERKPS